MWGQKHQPPPSALRSAVVESLERRELLSTFTVTNLADSGPGSLRQAVLDANANPGADLVNFQPGLSGAISTGGLAISDSLTIDGAGATVSVGGLNLFSSTASNLRISNLTLGGGNTTRDGGVLAIGGVNPTVVLDHLSITRGHTSGSGGIVFAAVPAYLAIYNSTLYSGYADHNGGAIAFHRPLSRAQ